MSSIDLHCHTSMSDGALSPTEVVNRAVERNLTHLAITDHDCISGIAEAKDAAMDRIEIIPGSELSTTFNNTQIHIVGLFLNPECSALKDYIDGQLQRRIERAVRIGQKLEKAGFANAYERTKEQAAEGAIITRGNYARFIFSQGKASSVDDAFNCYLKKGKFAYVNTIWPDIAEAVGVIHSAGGVAVLAHPRRYTLTNTKLRALLEYFRNCGGEAIEVASCQQRPCDREYLSSLCEKYGFMASCGSDFHYIGIWRDLGMHIDLPSNVKPVWLSPKAEAFNFPQL